jgi:RHS repeat-associated protein
MKLTGKERDAESGLDYFGARYYSSGQGRFTTPDWSAEPEPIPYADLKNPQSLNLYTYVRNDPLSLRDPDGHYCFFGVIGTTCSVNWPAKAGGSQQQSQPRATPGKAAGYLEVAAGVVAVGVVATNPEVGVLGALVGGIGGSASFVSGSSQILGAATRTDVSKGTKAVDAFGSPQGLVVGVVSGGNESLASLATTAGNIAGLVSRPESVAGIVDKVLAVTGLVTGELTSTYQTISNMISPPSPPTPAPPGLPPGWDQ